MCPPKLYTRRNATSYIVSFFPKQELFDISIYIKSDIEDCVRRLKIRNQCIPGYTPEEIEIRCENVDRFNAIAAQKTEMSADYRVDGFSFIQNSN